MGGALFLTAVVVVGCGNAKPTTQADLDVISDKCRLDKTALRIVDKDELRFKPAPNADYDAIACVMKNLQALQSPNIKIGFVHNEPYVPEAK